jgi:molybdate/tungstate transport system ATP-binding protein
VVRPENIVVSRQPIRTSARNEFRGEVRSVRREGSTCRVEARVDSPTMVAVVTPPSVRELGLEPGAEVYFSFKAHNVHLFTGDDMEGDAE